MPLTYARAVRQTEQSASIHLFGDRLSASYEDSSPLDGIDDAIGKLLLAMGARFSPIMVRNTTAVPMDWTTFVTRKRSFPLYVDRWVLTST